MKLSDRINYIKAAFSGQDQSIIRMVQRMTPVYGEPPRRSTNDWIDLYNKSPRMNPIHQIASDVATSMYGIYSKNDTKKIKIQNNNIETLLKNPTPNLTITEYVLFYITQVYLLLPSGEAFWVKERNGLGKISEIWPIPPGWVGEIPSRSKDYFTIYPQGNIQCQPIYVPPYDIVYFKKPDVNNPYLRGIGRAEGVGDEIETDEYMAKYQKRFFFNDAIPSMVGMMPGADEININRQKEKWQQEHGGYNNSNKVSWLNWDAKFQILKETNKDMDFIESRKYLRDSTNQHFSIPPELFGILENSNRSTIDAAYYLYTKNVLRKELKFIDDTLNIQLMPEFSKDQYIEHDNVVPEDEEFKLKKASEGLKNGGLLVDEWRMANGWEALPNNKGKILYTPLNMIPTNLDNANIELETNPTNNTIGIEKPADTVLNGAQISSLLQIVMSVANGEIPRETAIQIIMNAFMYDREKAENILSNAGQTFEPKQEENVQNIQHLTEPIKNVKKKLISEHKERLWHVFDKAAIKNERPFINAMKKYFQDQQDKINKSIGKSIKQATDNPDELIDWDIEDALLVAALTPHWTNSLTEGFTVANDTYGFGISFDLLNPKFLDWIEEDGLKQAKNINDTTKEKLRKTLSEGIEAGEGIPKLRDRISGVFTEAKTSRAEKIARTETHNTVGQGTFFTYGAANVKQKEWLTTMDTHERDSHAAINRQVVNIDQKFSNGLLFPGDSNGPAEEVVDCRCALLPVID